MLDILLTTIIKRPYVVAFLVSYLFIAWKIVGPKWTFFYLIAGYTIAFLSEYSSIHYKFPYGEYHYVYENLQGEWLNHGVPVWDSVSYVFMCFAGLSMAYASFRNPPKNKWALVLLSAVFTTILDIVTDPNAHMGERWFLGKIYYYPNPGFYFDITMANFMGWFLVSGLINAVGVFALKLTVNVKYLFLGIGLYYGILLFNYGITIYLQEWLLLACHTFWIALTFFILKRGFYIYSLRLASKADSSSK